LANPPALGSSSTAALGSEQQEDKPTLYTLTDHSNNPLQTLTWPNPGHLEHKRPKSQQGDPAPWVFQRTEEEEQSPAKGDARQAPVPPCSPVPKRLGISWWRDL